MADINQILANAPKKYVSWYYLPKVGYEEVKTFLAKIKVIETLKY